MNPTTARIVVWTGGAAIAAAAAATLVLTVARGDAVYAARLVAGLAGCL
ncbi:hypothetical protein [Oharaeibacter diazotrophicus]|uniref:Uncharacterized protein n=1 Tax=Oharaeibacter diazotrophicus TaxID=1920512 RepID=A0A4R6RD32_9HYPH|nr:hypothetical protein [Oharaeibacter diazotrophicus]TDP84049.1 hypothetical protein EDD54_2652 [Oharaeibacter diazotrophicus]BBE73088.1 hypothetical protein OHA_1_02694 [Pleomorphomonas sp. SM30]GLS74877.1 hypothetical protein GCM10007904_02120 [Oharaeibacter diazotrophicus]